MKKKILLVLGIVSAVLFAAALALTIYLAGTTSLIHDTGLKTGQQNNIIGYDGDNGILFIGTRTGSLFAYDNITHEMLWEFKSESGNVFTCLKVHANSGLIYAGNDDNLVYTLDIDSGALLNTLNVKRRVVDLDVTQDDATLATVTQTNGKANLLLFDLASGEQLFNTKYTYELKGVAFTHDQENILMTTRRGEILRLGFDGSVQAEGGAKYELTSLKNMGEGLYFSADTKGNYYFFNEECQITRQGTVQMISGAEVYNGNTDSNGENVIIGTKQGYVYVLNAQDQLIYQFRQQDNISVADFVADGAMMYITGYGDFVHVIEISSLETIAFLQSMASYVEIAMFLFAFCAIFLPLFYFQSSYKLLCRIARVFWKHKVAYLLLIPTFVLLVMFNYTPMVIAFTRAFTNWSSKNFTAADLEFVGLSNFRRMFTEGYFLIGLKNMAILMVTGFLKTLTMPLLAAWLVYSFKSDKKKYLFRFLFVLPIVVPGVVGALLWKQIYNPGGGLDQVLTALGLASWIHTWLGESNVAIWAIVFMGIPFIGALPFLVYYGGFTSIDGTLYEAAKIDGANRSRIFWRIQLPMIAPQIKLLIILQFIGSIQDYGGILLLTGGGPGTATYVPGLELYYNATTFGNYGYACAMGLVMFVFIMIGTIFNTRIKAENYRS